MSVRKRKWTTRLGETKEAWVVSYTGQNGARHIKTFDRKKDADAYHATVRVDVKAGIHTTGKTTVAQAAATWLADADTELERATVKTYREHLRLHIEPFLGAVKLSDLTVPTVRAFMDKLRAEGRSPDMIKRVIGDLGSILADAQDHGLVAQNVVRSLSRNRKKRRQVEKRHKANLRIGVDIPTLDEIRAIIAHLDGRRRPLILTAIFTGLRASELRGLVWLNVDLKKNEVHVRQRADRWGAIGRPKSASGERIVPLPPMAANALREWKLQCPKSESGLVFPTGVGTIENHTNIIERAFKPVQVKAGVVDGNGKAKYSPHQFRHFYASWCINRVADGGLGLPPKMVQHRLGHSSITLTMDRYGHLFPTGDDGTEMATAEKALFR
jgi:integrase